MNGAVLYREGATATGITQLNLAPGGNLTRLNFAHNADIAALPAAPEQEPTLALQLVNDRGACWEATFPAPPRVRLASRFADRLTGR